MPEAKLWTFPVDLRPVTEVPRLSDAAKLALLFERLHQIDGILRHGIPRRPGSRATIPLRDRDRVILQHVRLALELE